MLGLVYTTGEVPYSQDPLDLAAALSFELAGRYHHRYVHALTDLSGSVTAKSLRELVSRCDFIFYWGHGWCSAADGTVLYGTNGETIPLLDLGALEGRYLYLDGCRVGLRLDPWSYPHSRIVAPTRAISYSVSFRMGYTFMTELLEGATFQTAFRRASERMRSLTTYTSIGRARDQTLQLPRTVSETLGSLFDDFATAAGIARQGLKEFRG